MKIDFSGQVVLVTGATRGIGKQIADDFGRLGAELIVTGMKERNISDIRKSLYTNREIKITYHRVDFTDARSTETFIDELSGYDRIDVCINNAGINIINYIDETLTQDWDAITAVNLKAPFMIIREVSKIMKKNGYGRIVNIGSIFGVISKEKRSIYSVTKFGIRGLTVATSNELAKYNTLVNTVSPGFVLTDLTKNILSESEMADVAAQIPLQRFASPDEISCVVVFLASSLNTYITGQNVIVDGGYTNV